MALGESQQMKISFGELLEKKQELEEVVGITNKKIGLSLLCSAK